MWRAYLCDAMSGLIGSPVDIPAFFWSVSVSDCSFGTTRGKGAGEGDVSSVRLPWSAVPGSTPAARAAALASMRRAIALFWADDRTDEPGMPLLFGAIGARTDTAWDTSFSLESMTAILSRRYLVREGAFGSDGGMTSDEVRLSGMSQRAIACEVGRMCTEGKPGGSLPIDWSYLGERGSHERSFPGYDVQNLSCSSILENIAAAQGGPDMQFRPYMADGQHVRMAFIAGSDGDAHLSQGSVHHLGSLNDMSIAHQAPLSRVFATGAGSERTQLCYLAEDLSYQTDRNPRPLLEEAWSASDIASEDQLESQARGRLDAVRIPLAQISGWVDASQLSFGHAWPGEAFRLPIDGFPSLPDGVYDLRLMEMSGDEGSKVNLKFDVMADPVY